MKKLISWTLLLATMLFAACGGGEEPDGSVPTNSDITLSIAELKADATSLSVKISHTSATKYAYIVEQASLASSTYTAEELFEKGTAGACNTSGTTSFTVRNLTDNTEYAIYIVATNRENQMSDVAVRNFTTTTLPEYLLKSKSCTGFTASVRTPNTVPASSVIKWAITDLAFYNHNGGAGSEEQWLTRDEAIYSNYFTTRYDFDVNNNNSAFTKDGVTYYHYKTIQPGQPMVLLLGEYGEGSHSEYGMGHYSPLFGANNPNGYFRKEVIISTKPSTLNQLPSVNVKVDSSGKGTISIAKPTNAAFLHYLILDQSKYDEILALIDNNTSLLQWFTSSEFATEHMGAKSSNQPVVTISAESLGLKEDTQYYVLVTAWEDESGMKQSFAKVEFTLSPAAPLPTDNTIIAHRGGSAEAGKSSTPDNSIASLKYAMSLGCYASEADIYWTKDNQIIIAHADSNCKINGLYPWESTLAQLQAAGKLSNGETLPSLEDYIRTVMVKGSKTKICLDIKSITKPTTHHAESVKACQRACEIIVAMGAQNFCEFICSGYEDIVKNCAKYANAAGIDIGAMGNFSASKYKGWGYTWHNRDKGYEIPADKINSYINAGMEVSVFTIDSDADWALISSYYKSLRGITTNYPNRLLAKFRK